MDDIVDQVFARGFVLDAENMANIDPTEQAHFIDSGKLVDEFNTFVANDRRVKVTTLPFFDGISEISLS